VNETLKLKQHLKKIKQTTGFDVPRDNIINNINNNIMIIILIMLTLIISIILLILIILILIILIILKTSLIIHEEKTREITTVGLYVIKIMSFYIKL
jgi:hypothetical protein